MKALLVGEYKQGKVEESSYELVGFAKQLGLDAVMFFVADDGAEIKFDGKVYVADAGKYTEYNPDLHKALIEEVINKENPDLIVFSHSSYGWDIAFRVAADLKVAAISEVVDFNKDEKTFIVPCCNSKFRREVKPKTDKVVVTLQGGAFQPVMEGSPQIEKIDLPEAKSNVEFLGFVEKEKVGVDLTSAEIIVSAGRGVGKKENVEIVKALADALGGELGASRPVVDAGWVDPSRQVGTTGQIVAPKLYIACGISGAIQHLAGMKKSNFIVAINKDKDAPISEVADVFVAADLLEFVPVLTEKLKK
ncbi:electron transfer flavoprotein subunit alpha/FixB family protein [Hippea jasoniae]|uniref:electron transfer flavoprotein subunit alpha/FixB family protein n=1 Tax=Hippea jasoniae TaxID=944479 RepID=UPI00054DDE05|nr:electron transfer flavoprotein subunit alpha/FixB family protein [Hippea jasoniae]